MKCNFSRQRRHHFSLSVFRADARSEWSESKDKDRRRTSVYTVFYIGYESGAKYTSTKYTCTRALDVLCTVSLRPIVRFSTRERKLEFCYRISVGTNRRLVTNCIMASCQRQTRTLSQQLIADPINILVRSISIGSIVRIHRCSYRFDRISDAVRQMHSRIYSHDWRPFS